MFSDKKKVEKSGCETADSEIHDFVQQKRNRCFWRKFISQAVAKPLILKYIDL